MLINNIHLLVFFLRLKQKLLCLVEGGRHAIGYAFICAAIKKASIHRPTFLAIKKRFKRLYECGFKRCQIKK